MRTVLYPGSFDPLTNGHLDLIERASRLFDRVVVAVAVNAEKNPMFTISERVKIIKESTVHLDNVDAVCFEGLLVNALNVFNATAVLRGLRAFSDFEYELQMALMNRSLREDCETIFMMPHADNSFVSSRVVKEVALLGGDFTRYVPGAVVPAIREKIGGAR